jgi:hypothetical protein
LAAVTLALAVAAVVALAPQPAVITTQDVAHWARTERRDADARALRFLIRAAWTEGEARERGIVVTRRQVGAALADEVESAGGRRAYRRSLHRHRLTRADARQKLRVELLDAAIKEQIAQPAAESVTEEQIDGYVADHPTQEPETRDVRFLLAKTPAKARRARQELERGATWRGVGRRYAISGRATLTRDARPRDLPAGDAAFEAPARKLEGPVRRKRAFVIFKVIAITPAHPTPAPVQRARAWEILASEAQEQALDAFSAAFTAKWRARTTCAPDLADQPDCGGAT